MQLHIDNCYGPSEATAISVKFNKFNTSTLEHEPIFQQTSVMSSSTSMHGGANATQRYKSSTNNNRTMPPFRQ